MTDQVTELAPGDIQHGGDSVSVGGAQPQGFREEAAQPEPMTADQQAMIPRIGEIRERLKDQTIDHATRETAMRHLSELSKAAFGLGKVPAWYGDAKPDPRATDTSEHDPLADAMHGVTALMSDKDAEQFRTAGRIQGLHPEVSEGLTLLVKELGMPLPIANLVQQRFVRHFGEAYDRPALADISPLSEEDRQIYYETATEMHPGGAEAFDKLSAEARQALADRGVLERLDKSGFTDSSLAFDARLLNAIVLWGKTAAK